MFSVYVMRISKLRVYMEVLVLDNEDEIQDYIDESDVFEFFIII